MKNLQLLEIRLINLTNEYNEYFRCHVYRKNKDKSYYHDLDTIMKLKELQRNIDNTRININQVKMRLMNKE